MQVQKNTAFSRRKFKNGSRQKQDTSRKRKLELPNRRVKREHNFVKTVKFNKPLAKKYSTMSSTTPTKGTQSLTILRLVLCHFQKHELKHSSCLCKT